MKNSIISGAYDLHIHSTPDCEPRKLDDLEMAQRVINSGMAGYAIKSHSACTADRAYVVNKLFPECDAIGTVTMNNFQGGINPLMVDMAAHLGVKIVWFPTTDSESAFCGMVQKNNNRPNLTSGYAGIVKKLQDSGIQCAPVEVLDDDGNVLPEVNDVLDVIRANDLIMGTGHLSTAEILVLVKAAYERGVRKIVITHVSSKSPFRAKKGNEIPLWNDEVQMELLKYGAYVEHCALPVLAGWLPVEEVIRQIKLAGPERAILSSDLGQVTGKYPDEGFLEFCNILVENGLPEIDVRKMIVDNPKELIGA